ncbi:MAG: RNase adapter RapZ [Pseudomonadales bacterium]
MRLIILSGRSGSGKSTALHALEDAGFNCIDNFPIELLQALMQNALSRDDLPGSSVANQAVCIDARTADLKDFPAILIALDAMGIDCQVIYLDALSPTLVKRFSETRRKHPLTSDSKDLKEAIDSEQRILEGIADLADLTIDTTALSAQQLIELIQTRVIDNDSLGLSLLFRSFGFKYGVPVDADFVFDVRCLPNPHWVEHLRPLTGLDEPVADYLAAEDMVNRMFGDVSSFVENWLRSFEENNRTYLTVAIGCTGGQHRSVYLANRLGEHFKGLDNSGTVLVRHRELNKR